MPSIMEDFRGLHKACDALSRHILGNKPAETSEMAFPELPRCAYCGGGGWVGPFVCRFCTDVGY